MPSWNLSKDRELDSLTDDLNERLVGRASSDSELVTCCVDLIFIARALERIGDHATNIAEDSFWRDQAGDIRHTYTPKDGLVIASERDFEQVSSANSYTGIIERRWNAAYVPAWAIRL